jgi:hypothetical protein
VFQVEIEVNLCFCSENLCNDPNGELLSGDATKTTSSIFMAVAVSSAAMVVSRASW